MIGWKYNTDTKGNSTYTLECGNKKAVATELRFEDGTSDYDVAVSEFSKDGTYNVISKGTFLGNGSKGQAFRFGSRALGYGDIVNVIA